MVGTKHLLELFLALSIEQWNDERADRAVSEFPACVQLIIELRAFGVEIVTEQEREEVEIKHHYKQEEEETQTTKALKIEKYG
jgi:hypothetical protein